MTDEDLARRIEKLKEKAALSDERHEKMLAAVQHFPSEESLPEAVLDQWARIDRSNPSKKNILVLITMHLEEKCTSRM